MTNAWRLMVERMMRLLIAVMQWQVNPLLGWTVSLMMIVQVLVPFLLEYCLHRRG